jgi:hypothetical protein
MRIWVLALALVLWLPLPVQSQETPDTTKIVMTRAEFVQLQNDVRALLVSDSLNLEIMKAQEWEIHYLRSTIREDSLLISFKDRRIELLEDLNKLFENRMVMTTSTPKWYDNRGVWMTVGGTIVVISSKLFGR